MKERENKQEKEGSCRKRGDMEKKQAFRLLHTQTEKCSEMQDAWVGPWV